MNLWMEGLTLTISVIFIIWIFFIILAKIRFAFKQVCEIPNSEKTWSHRGTISNNNPDNSSLKYFGMPVFFVSIRCCKPVPIVYRSAVRFRPWGGRSQRKTSVRHLSPSGVRLRLRTVVPVPRSLVPGSKKMFYDVSYIADRTYLIILPIKNWIHFC